MFKSRSSFVVLFVALAILAALTACGPSPTPETIIETVIVEKIVEKVVTQEVEIEKVVTKEVEKVVEIPVTIEVEKIVTETVEVMVTPTPEPLVVVDTVERVPAPEESANIVAIWVISQAYTFPVEGTRDQYEQVTYAYDVRLVTDTLVFPTDVITITAERDYGYMSFTRQGNTEPVLEVVLDDQAVAYLLWAWSRSHDGAANPTLGTLNELHWVYRNEQPIESGNNLSFSKGWGWYINEGNILLSTFNSEIPKVGAIWRAAVLGPEMANYGNALEREGIDAWDRWFDHRGIQEEPLGVYTHFK